MQETKRGIYSSYPYSTVVLVKGKSLQLAKQNSILL